MLNDPLYQELVELEAEFDKDEVTVSDLKAARRALAITKELRSQYGDKALIYQTLSAARLAQILILVDGDEYEIVQLYTLALEGFDQMSSEECEDRDYATMQLELHQQLCSIYANQENAKETLDCVRKTLHLLDSLDKKYPETHVDAYIKFWHFAQSVFEEFTTKKEHKAFIAEQQAFHMERMMEHPVSSYALLAAIEYTNSEIYNNNNQPRKTLNAKIKTCDWQSKSLDMKDETCDMHLVIYTSDLAGLYMKNEDYVKASVRLREIIDAVKDEGVYDEDILPIVAQAHLMVIECVARLGLESDAEEYLTEALEHIPFMLSQTKNTETRGELLNTLSSLKVMRHSVLFEETGDMKKAIPYALEALQHISEAVAFNESEHHLNELQRILLICGDAYLMINKEKEAKKCYSEVIDIHEENFGSDDFLDDQSPEDQALIKSFIGDDKDLEELFHTEEEKRSAALSAIAEEKIEALDS